MTDLICCRDCGSPSCRGCNVKTLDDLLESGVLDKFMDEHYTIRKEKIVNTAPVVRCGECEYNDWCMTDFDGFGRKDFDFCPYGERRKDNDD